MEATSTRFNGTLKKWNAERGFGFVAAEQGGQELFLHVSAMPRDGWIPVVGEPLSFEIELDKEGRKRAVRVRRPGVPQLVKASRPEQGRHQTRRIAQRAGSSSVRDPNADAVCGFNNWNLTPNTSRRIPPEYLRQIPAPEYPE